MKITCIFPRNIFGAIRVIAGRDGVEPGLASSLTSRNHVLEDLFCAKTLTMQQKKKKKKDGADDDSEEEDSGEVHKGCMVVYKTGYKKMMVIAVFKELG